MYFTRETVRVLPNGELANVAPFHVSTEGQEDRVILRDEDDLRAAHNLIPICAHRANVIVLADCELNTHIHAALLARSEEDAERFILSFKMSLSKHLTRKYGEGSHLRSMKGIESKPLPLLDNRHLRNSLCYIPRNALDVGEKVESYRWSSYRAMFSNGHYQEEVLPMSSLTYRQKRRMFKTDCIPEGTGWMVTRDGVIEPASYCDIEYAQGAFNNEVRFFMKVLGLIDDQQMKQELTGSTRKMTSVQELMSAIEEHCRRTYSKSSIALTFAQKIPIIKKVWHTKHTSVAQMARCFGQTRKEILFALGKKEM